MSSLESAPVCLTAAERQKYHHFGRLHLPRHTSYPSVPFWTEQTDSRGFLHSLRELAQSSKPVSWYVHVPFCERLCHYCGCNKLIVSRAHGQASDFAARYLASLANELDHIPTYGRWNVQQIHFGGGTPTWLTPNELVGLWQRLTKDMTIASDAEISIELDPRVTSDEHLNVLRTLGFNRVSLGVQDFASNVQQAIQRIQPFEMVAAFTEKCRKAGFKSVNFDLIYGLPMQSVTSMQETIRLVNELRPDRIAFYRLALMPEIFKWQRTFRHEDIPDDDTILNFMLLAQNCFSDAGYEFLGLDHFALTSDELSQSYRNGTMRRTFQGMTTGHELPVVGIGPSAISCLDDMYAQNEVQFPAWARRVQHELAIVKHHKLSRDDIMARWTINQLYSYRRIDKKEFERKFNINFDVFYADAQSDIMGMEQAGLIDSAPSEIKLRRGLGWLLLRAVAAAFDRYLKPGTWQQGLESRGGSRVG